MTKLTPRITGGVAGTPPFRPVQPPRPHSSLTVASLDIGRVLADRDGTTFRAQGTCMYPTIRPGDVLRIRSCTAADVVVGDIAVCRTSGYLFGHRVIERGVRDGRSFVVTRSDRATRGGDQPTFDEHLLGVVVSIERDGAPVPLRPTAYPRALRECYRVRLAFAEMVPRARTCLATALSLVQDRPAYRHAARCWFASTRLSLSFSVRVPLNATLGDAVYRELMARDFDPDAMPQGRPVDRWSLVLRVHGVREPAARATFVRDPSGAWAVEQSRVRVRYRGMGLDDALMRQAERIVGGAVGGGPA